MKDAFHNSWSAILLSCINVWCKRSGLSRGKAAHLIVEAYSEFGEPVVGGEFRKSDDMFKDAEINAQRIFRWLDDQTKDSTLLPANFVPVILKALPVDLRLRAVNEMLSPLGISAEEGAGQQSLTAADFSRTLARLCKETGEAQASVAMLTDGVEPGELEAARAELQDVVSVASGALNQVEQAIQNRQ